MQNTKRPFTTTLNADIAHQAKIKAVTLDMDMGRIIDSLLQQWLEDKCEVPYSRRQYVKHDK